MKKISNQERSFLQMDFQDKYNAYRCPEHLTYLCRKDVTEENQVCPYCKKKFPVLSQEDIEFLINQ